MKLGEEREYTVAYADDIVLMAEREDEMRSMLERLEGYLDKKRLKLNLEKTKIMRFSLSGEEEIGWRKVDRVRKKRW